MDVKTSVLYITYDGLTDPLGQSQILAYLKRLSFQNRIVILSYEKKDLYQKQGDAIRKIVNENNLRWIPLTYTKKPPILSTMLDIQRGTRAAEKLHKEYKFQIVHCRGYISSIIGRKLKKKYDLKFIFDMRGWWVDEKKESGLWDNKIYQPVYKYFKGLEKKFFSEADFSVSLTHKGKEEIEKQQLADPEKIGVIPTCVDFEIFKPYDVSLKNEMRKKLGVVPGEKVFVYSGSLGGNYDPETLISVFKSFRQVYPESFLLVLSKDEFDQGLRQKFASNGINRMAIYNVPFMEVSDYLRAADVGFIYYKMSFSTIGRSPTKLGEYWASGIPVIAFRGIGDLDYIFGKYRDCGILLSGDPGKWADELLALKFTDPELQRNYAKDYFSIEKGVEFYQKTYSNLSTSK